MLSRRHILLTASASLALAGSAARAQGASGAAKAKGEGASGAGAQLNKALDDFFAQDLADNPEVATSLGLDTGANAAAKSKLSQASVADLDRYKHRTVEQLARLRAVDRKALTGMAAVNYDSVLYDLDTTDRGNRRFAYGGEGAGAPYVLSQINGAYQGVPDFLDSQHTIETRADCEAYVARLGEFSRLMDQECERVRRDAGLGVIPPDFAIAGALGQMKVLHAPADKSTLVSSVADRARAKGVAGDWAREATAVYEGKVLPALERQMALLESLRPKAIHEAGVWRLPDGEAYYALALQAQTTTTMTPAEVHKLGLDVTRELTARADVLFRKIGLTQGSVAERYAALFKDPKYVYPNTDAGKAKEIADLNKLVQAMQKRLPEYFGALPKAGLEIRRIPPATEAGASTHYTSGSLDGSRPGIYWLNLRDTAEAPYWDMPTTTFHEGIPGHHLQLTLQKQADLPLLRKVAGFNAYAEGWALYSEQLAQEMGFYADDPAGELGYVHDALLRSGRLVVDTGIHAMRWSREKAVQTLHETDGDPIALAGQEIERYACNPGQACGYMVGKVFILRLREKAKAALGPRFDVRQFHDAVLLAGSLPLTVLENAVDNYIAARKA
ncbi:MAG: Tat pathway signal protein [Phenylobacterium sp.]|nr:Tat pathway signal protein [Phenylobacterium sp.]MDB5437220.1 Tat pathway signal protein [Phenylobacterium sp.]MDB5464308.1 Tat pathway signal protein [Phenylobacterium sp.]